MGLKKYIDNNEKVGDKCSASCIKAGTTVLIFALFGLGLLQQLSKQDHLEKLTTYINLRFMLSEQVKLLQFNPCWKDLTEDIGPENIKKYTIDKLLDHECTFRAKNININKDQEQYEQKEVPVKEVQDVKKIPPPKITGLGIVSPIQQLLEISDILEKLNESKLLADARKHSSYFNFSIFKWENLRYRFVLSDSDDIAWVAWGDIPSNDREGKYSYEKLFEHLTIDDAIKLAEYEYPEWDKVESIIERNKINIPSFPQSFQIIDASVLIEIVILISIIYFWVFLQEAKVSINYPEEGTFFSAIGRTKISKFYFFCLLLFPSAISILIGTKTIAFNKFNIVCGLVTLIFIAKIWANIFKTYSN